MCRPVPRRATCAGSTEQPILDTGHLSPTLVAKWERNPRNHGVYTLERFLNCFSTRVAAVPTDSTQTLEFAKTASTREREASWADTFPDETPRFANGTVTPPEGDYIGRYEVLEELGAGTMGVVYRALDPELQREVAVKIHRLGSAQTPNAARFRKRLFREGQALARVSDPNVVTVYDVGLFRGQVFVAMELVRGRTLGQWLHERKRSSSAIIARYLGLARGLAAAHHAGLVHRDVKPANAIVGDDGRVRVVDFGLACGDLGARDLALIDTPLQGHKRITENGIVMGTPAYIAPEQLAGESVSESTDQFSFCVALWEALTGTLPFPSNSLLERANAIEARSYQGQDKLPRSVRQILARGLHPSPERRHPSMTALASKLRRTQTRKDRRPRILALATVLFFSFLGAMHFSQSEEPENGADAAGLHSKQAIEELLEFARRQVEVGHIAEAQITLDLVEEAEANFGRPEIEREIEELRSWQDETGPSPTEP